MENKKFDLKENRRKIAETFIHKLVKIDYDKLMRWINEGDKEFIKRLKEEFGIKSGIEQRGLFSYELKRIIDKISKNLKTRGPTKRYSIDYDKIKENTNG